MNADLLRKARQLWTLPHVPRNTCRHNQLAWARSVTRLGDRWLLARPVEKKEPQ